MLRFCPRHPAQAALCMISTVVASAILVSLSQQLVAQTKDLIRDPCEAVFSRIEGVQCSSHPFSEQSGEQGSSEYKSMFLVQEYQNFAWTDQAKLALASIFDANAAAKASIVHYAPLEQTDDAQVIDALKAGVAYPAVTTSDGKIFVFTAVSQNKYSDWEQLLQNMNKEVKAGEFVNVGIVSKDRDALPVSADKKEIFSWGDRYRMQWSKG